MNLRHWDIGAERDNGFRYFAESRDCGVRRRNGFTPHGRRAFPNIFDAGDGTQHIPSGEYDRQHDNRNGRESQSAHDIERRHDIPEGHSLPCRKQSGLRGNENFFLCGGRLHRRQ